MAVAGSVLVHTSTTGDLPWYVRNPEPRYCPGCTGEISKSAAVRILGCTFCEM